MDHYRAHLRARARCRHPSGEFVTFEREVIEQSIPDRFAKIVARYSDHLAIQEGECAFTYAELNRAANRVAHAILDLNGPQPEPVAMLLDHGTDAVIALMGVLTTGKYYVPLNAHDPQPRREQILDDAGATILLCDDRNSDDAHRLAAGNQTVINLNTIDPSVPDFDPEIRIAADAYAYLLYTSGSTGPPKGVVGLHRNVLRFTMALTNDCGIGANDRSALIQSLAFSGSVAPLFMTILNGGALLPFDVPRQGITPLAEWLVAEEVSVMVAGEVFRSLCPYLDGTQSFPHLRLIYSGGGPTYRYHFETYRKVFTDDCILVNSLSTTEVSGLSRFFMDKETEFEGEVAPLGFADADLELLVWDEEQRQVPPGEIGEIAVRTRFMGPGYWNRPDLTQEKYVYDPDLPGQRVYRTGDLGKMLPDGCLMHLGRIDHQVKIRGHRVEISEVESLLNRLSEVREVVVHPYENQTGGQALAAYVVSEQGGLRTEQLRSALLKVLPDYAVPQSFVFLDALPRLTTGKVNRQALPTPDHSRPRLATPFHPPRSPLERELAQIWTDVLEIEPIGVHDDFFHLGGDSIQAMRIISRLRDMAGSIVHIQAIMDAPTVAEMAAYLGEHYLDRPAADAPDSEVDPVAGQDRRYAAPFPPIDSTHVDRFRNLIHASFAEITGRNSSQNKNAQKNAQVVFILAPPRSGTTLLRAMLAGHPSLFAPPELYLLNYADLAQRKQANEGRTTYRLEGTIRGLMALYGCSAEDAKEKMGRFEAQNLSTHAFYAELQAAACGRMLVDKTPVYASDTAILQRAEEWFDEPYYVHLGRHPLATIHSYVANNFHLRSDSPSEFAPNQLAELTWLTYHQNIFTHLQNIPAHRQIRLRYEDLVTAPSPAMQRLSDFLNLEPSAGMLDPYRDADSRMTNGLYADSWMIGDPNFWNYSEVTTDRVDAGREALPTGLLCAESVALARQLGYADL